MPSLRRSPVAFLAFALPLAVAACEKPTDPSSGPPTAPAVAQSTAKPQPWGADHLVAPAELAKRIGAPDAPVLLFVGPDILFSHGHIPGTIGGGEASDADGLARIKQKAERIPRDAEVVIYCGCCPRKNCPNIPAAYRALSAMGFTKLKVLDLPTTYRTDWAEKGYPSERSAAH